MKYIILSLFIIPAIAFGQNTGYGYVNGVRLDSLPAKYIEIESNILRVSVSYGQPFKKMNETTLKDKDGKVFQPNGIADLFNFMDYNGWEYVDLVTTIYLFRRKKS